MRTVIDVCSCVGCHVICEIVKEYIEVLGRADITVSFDFITCEQIFGASRLTQPVCRGCITYSAMFHLWPIEALFTHRIGSRKPMGEKNTKHVLILLARPDVAVKSRPLCCPVLFSRQIIPSRRFFASPRTPRK